MRINSRLLQCLSEWVGSLSAESLANFQRRARSFLRGAGVTLEERIAGVKCRSMGSAFDGNRRAQTREYCEGYPQSLQAGSPKHSHSRGRMASQAGLDIRSPTIAQSSPHV